MKFAKLLRTPILKNILSKEVKEVIQKRGGGTGVAMELLK